MNKIKLANQIKHWAKEIGFAEIGITDPDLSPYQKHFKSWLAHGYQAEMNFMNRHQEKRINPQELMNQTKSIICVAVNHEICNTLSPCGAKLSSRGLTAGSSKKRPNNPDLAIKLQDDNNLKEIASSYVTKCDYHKVMHKKLHQLADKINSVVENFRYRAFCDSAPVLEKALAEKAGLGWIGKYTCLLTKKHGSQIFLGELFTNLELPFDKPCNNHCNTCSKCIDACPTKALKAPHTLDAKLCIAYLTIEHQGSIPVELRKLIGQRIAGCDECQLSCPWNKNIRQIPKNYAQTLIKLFNWTEKEFLTNTQNTTIIRIGYKRWLRNLAIALGNSPYDPAIIAVLKNRLNYPSAMVQEHVQWAIKQQNLLINSVT
ncbi:MAG: tRNA epoxyqueuosine(34) reductase QueG [Gammaproteobacteria bacterium]